MIGEIFQHPSVLSLEFAQQMGLSILAAERSNVYRLCSRQYFFSSVGARWVILRTEYLALWSERVL